MGKQVKKHGYSCKLVRVVDGDTCELDFEAIKENQEKELENSN